MSHDDFPDGPARRRPPSAFAREYLERLEQEDDSWTAAEADFAGPWKVEPTAEGHFAVLREWESPSRGHRPVAVFKRREVALLAAAVLPVLGRDSRFSVSGGEEAKGFPVRGAAGEAEPGEVGWLREHNREFVSAMNVGLGFAANPRSLTLLLLSAGSTAQELLGELLASGALAGEP